MEFLKFADMEKEDEAALSWALENRKAIRKQLQGMGRKAAKGQAARQLDQQFNALHAEAFANRDCLTCANCCRTTSPIFRDRDIDRLAKHLRIKPAELLTRYLRMDEDGDYVLRSSPCPFLDLEDNQCGVYPHRPLACREYPHTDRKNMAGILPLTERNAQVCPAVANMVRSLLKPS
ncbi:MAG: YkgJ family cysteine cluster protein [Flavobacteriales bacterium]